MVWILIYHHTTYSQQEKFHQITRPDGLIDKNPRRNATQLLLHLYRVTKCYGYGGYIRVNKLESWGKKSGKKHSYSKTSIVLGKFEQII